MIPVILDTDLGADIDDHWAILMLLNSPELDIRLITVGSGDTAYRARLLVDLLICAGRTDIPIGIGEATTLPGTPWYPLPEGASVRSLADYPGTIHDDAASAMVATIRESVEPVTVLAIGPVTNLAAALRLDSSICARSRLIAMAGNLRGGPLNPGGGADEEYNVCGDIGAFAEVLASDWEITLAPLDSCGLIQLAGDRYAQLREASAPALDCLFRAYREWCLDLPETADADDDFARLVNDWRPRSMHERSSSILFDTLVVFLAYGTGFIELERMTVSMDERGVLGEASRGRPVSVAMSWTDREGFLDHLTARMLGGTADAGW